MDRLKVQQREAGVRHDLIDAVFALGGEDDLVRLLARVRALQSVLATDDGANLLAGVKRATNILRIEEAKDSAAPLPLAGGAGGGGGDALAASPPPPARQAASPTRSAGGRGAVDASLFTEPAETALAAALDVTVPMIEQSVAAEDFTAAMAALAGLRAPVDAFFDAVIVNADDPAVRANRLALLARLRDAASTIADFSKVV